MKDTIQIRDELVLEAHPEGPDILLRREGEPGSVRIYLNEVRHPADAIRSTVRRLEAFLHGGPG